MLWGKVAGLGLGRGRALGRDRALEGAAAQRAGKSVELCARGATEERESRVCGVCVCLCACGGCAPALRCRHHRRRRCASLVSCVVGGAR